MSVPETSTYKPQGKRPCGSECPDLEQLHHEDLLKDISQGHREKMQTVLGTVQPHLPKCLLKKNPRKKKKHSLERHAEGDPTRASSADLLPLLLDGWTSLNTVFTACKKTPANRQQQFSHRHLDKMTSENSSCQDLARSISSGFPPTGSFVNDLLGIVRKNEGNPHCLRRGGSQKCNIQFEYG